MTGLFKVGSHFTNPNPEKKITYLQAPNASPQTKLQKNRKENLKREIFRRTGLFPYPLLYLSESSARLTE